MNRCTVSVMIFVIAASFFFLEAAYAGRVEGSEFSDLDVGTLTSYGVMGSGAAASDRSIVVDFVTRFYNHCLWRDPDPTGLDGWVNGLINGWVTGEDLAEGFILSPEFILHDTSNETFLLILYRAFFDREPDPEGFSGWLQAMQNGKSRESVLEGFIHSSEFDGLCHRYGITSYTQDPVEAFVTRFYNECLNRSPDTEGMNGWVRALKNKWIAGGDLAEGFILSEEFKNRYTSDADFLTILYRAFFDREPDWEGFYGWLEALQRGSSRESVLAGFIASNEFHHLCSQYGIIVSGTDSADDKGVRYDHFDDGYYNDRWYVYLDDGASTADEFGTELHVTIQKPSSDCDSFRLQTLEMFSGKNMTVEAKIRQLGKGGSGISLHKDDDNNVKLRLGTDDVPCVQFFSRENGVVTKQQCIESSSAYLGRDNILKIVKAGNQYSAYINGEKKGETFTNAGIGDVDLTGMITAHTCRWKSGDADVFFDYVDIASEDVDGDPPVGECDKEDLAGVWIVVDDETSANRFSEQQVYIDFDVNGEIKEFQAVGTLESATSMAFNDDCTFAGEFAFSGVDGILAYNGRIDIASDGSGSGLFSGHLKSRPDESFSGKMEKVADTSALEGRWTGTYNESGWYGYHYFPLDFQISKEGEFIDFSDSNGAGMAHGVKRGKFYAAPSGTIVGYVEVQYYAHGRYERMLFNGRLSEQTGKKTIQGTIFLDSDDNITTSFSCVLMGSTP